MQGLDGVDMSGGNCMGCTGYGNGSIWAKIVGIRHNPPGLVLAPLIFGTYMGVHDHRGIYYKIFNLREMGFYNVYIYI